jgi:pantetheine-phosphate adenylyltransferase
MQTFNHAIIGGTFDHFHRGHEAMLQKAFGISEKVSIGITTLQMYQDKALINQIEPFEIREQSLKSFLKKNGWLTRAVILPINNKYGSTLTDPTIDAIVVSPETEKTAYEIQTERVKKGLSPIEIVVVPFVLSDDGEIVSSERIRSGLINRNGTSYLTFFEKKAEYFLPDSLREDLQKPIGTIIKEASDLKSFIKQDRMLVTVGDIVTTSLLKKDIMPTVAVIDLKTRRENLNENLISQFFPNLKPDLSNPAGTITSQFAQIFLDKLQTKPKGEIIYIKGEEDLLTLPTILLSPLGTLVIYGQFEIGMVVIEVTEEIKEMIKKLLLQFSELQRR